MLKKSHIKQTLDVIYLNITWATLHPPVKLDPSSPKTKEFELIFKRLLKLFLVFQQTVRLIPRFPYQFLNSWEMCQILLFGDFRPIDFYHYYSWSCHHLIPSLIHTNKRALFLGKLIQKIIGLAEKWCLAWIRKLGFIILSSSFWQVQSDHSEWKLNYNVLPDFGCFEKFFNLIF